MHTRMLINKPTITFFCLQWFCISMKIDSSSLLFVIIRPFLKLYINSFFGVKYINFTTPSTICGMLYYIIYNIILMALIIFNIFNIYLFSVLFLWYLLCQGCCQCQLKEYVDFVVIRERLYVQVKWVSSIKGIRL